MYATIQRGWIPPTDAGVRETLRVMGRLVRGGGRLVDEEAAAIAGRAGHPARFPDALRTWLARHVVETADPYNVELIRAPDYALQVIQERGHVEGDCDDVATLGAALALAAGFIPRFVALAWEGPYAHVFSEVQDPGSGRWVDLDVHRPPPHHARPPMRELISYPTGVAHVQQRGGRR